MSLFFITLRRGPTFFTLCAGPHPRAPTATRSSLAALVSGDCPFSLWFCAGPRALPPARLARAFALVRAAGPACSLKLFRAFVFSWLHLFLSSCHKQPGALRVSVRRKRDDSGIHEACIVQHTPYVIVGKAEPDVTHLLTVALAIVREHVDDNRATAWLERADDVRERVPRLRHVMEHQHQRRRIKPPIVDRQRLELAPAPVDVVELVQTLPSGLQHRRRLVHGDHPRDKRRERGADTAGTAAEIPDDPLGIGQCRQRGEM